MRGAFVRILRKKWKWSSRDMRGVVLIGGWGGWWWCFWTGWFRFWGGGVVCWWWWWWWWWWFVRFRQSAASARRALRVVAGGLWATSPPIEVQRKFHNENSISWFSKNVRIERYFVLLIIFFLFLKDDGLFMCEIKSSDVIKWKRKECLWVCVPPNKRSRISICGQWPIWMETWISRTIFQKWIILWLWF